VEPRTQTWDTQSGSSSVVEGPELDLWLTYRVLAADGAWPLPRLAEKRNVYWDSGSARLVNGEPQATQVAEWLPTSVLARAKVQPVSHRVDLPGGLSVVARPVEPGDIPQQSVGLKLGVVVDRSRSMKAHRDDVKAALASLAKVADPTGSDVYLTASAYSGDKPSRTSLGSVDADGLRYLGGQNPAELLAQFRQLSPGRSYDAVIVLTDGTGYELGGGGGDAAVPDAPVWMVHLGGGLPLGYDDATLEAIQASGGGVAGSVDEALTQLAVARAGAKALASGEVMTALTDGYLWSSGPTASVAAGGGAAEPGFTPLAARRAVLAQSWRDRQNLGQVGTLDRLHQLALQAGVVTPYSSMIVLVEARQQQLLNQLEAQGDRYVREVEDVGDTKADSSLSVTGVPEPEEWLLLALAAAMLVWYARRRPTPTARAHQFSE
jgi:putative PEP-CTERM system integral membrane protein